MIFCLNMILKDKTYRWKTTKACQNLKKTFTKREDVTASFPEIHRENWRTGRRALVPGWL